MMDSEPFSKDTFPRAIGKPEENESVRLLLLSVEEYLLSTAETWLPETAQRARTLLREPKILREFAAWVDLSRREDSADELSPAMQQHSSKVQSRWRSGALEYLKECVARDIDHQDEDDQIDFESVVLLGMQYVVFRYLPGPHEFRGAYIHSNILSDEKLGIVGRSIRVPYRRGAVNWMTDLTLSHPNNVQVVTLDDAGMDLRGRVAAEDLVIGNRSVCGFPVFLHSDGSESSDPNSLSGFFFVSHALPKLFTGLFPSGVEKLMGRIRAQFGRLFVSAIDTDLIARFGSKGLSEDLRVEEDYDQTGADPAVQINSLVSLSSDDLSGFMASVLLEPRGTTLRTFCSVNESAFLDAIWSDLGILSTFPSKWANDVISHLEAYAQLIENNGNSDRSLAWIPQYPILDEKDSQRTDAHYPQMELKRLNGLVPSHNWTNWHFAHLKDDAPATSLHQRLRNALGTYSAPLQERDGGQHADLVVPLVGNARSGAGIARRVTGFLRFNCDAVMGSSREVTTKDCPSTDLTMAPYRTLFTLLSKHKNRLDATVGQLLVILDDDTARLLWGPKALAKGRARTYRQMRDSIRLFTEWVAMAFTGQLGGRAATSAKVVSTAFTYMWGDDDYWVGVSEHDRVAEHATHLELLSTCIDAVQEVAKSLGDQRGDLEQITLVSFWSRMWQPIIEEMPEGNEEALADLFMDDPGLPQLLSSLVCTATWKNSLFERPVDIGKRLRIKIPDNNEGQPQVMGDPVDISSEVRILDFGLPPRDSSTEKLTVQCLGSDRTLMRLEWQKRKDEKVVSFSALLRWSTSPDDTRRSFLTPVAASVVGGRVSRRVGRIVSGASELLTDDPVSQSELIAQSLSKKDSGEPSLVQRLRNLRAVFFGHRADMDDSRYWKTVSFGSTLSAALLVLHDPDIARPLVKAFRSVACRNAAGTYAAQALAREQAVTEQRTAIEHGLKWPSELLTRSLNRIVDKSDSLELSDLKSLLRQLADQCHSISSRAEDSVHYYRSLRDAPFFENTLATQVLKEVSFVARAYQNPVSPNIIDELVGGETVPRSARIRLAIAIFRHGISKLVENAVEHAIFARGRVRLSHFSRPEGLFLTIDNNVESAQIERAIIATRQGLVEGVFSGKGLGLREARRCFQRLSLVSEVDRGLDERNRGVLMVRLFLSWTTKPQ